jgi:hypothetical protein
MYCYHRPIPIAARSKALGLRPLGCWYCGFESAGAWMFVSCEGCLLSGRGLCDELITRPEESYWLLCVVECDLETSWMGGPWSDGGCRAKNKQNCYQNSLSIMAELRQYLWTLWEKLNYIWIEVTVISHLYLFIPHKLRFWGFCQFVRFYSRW